MRPQERGISAILPRSRVDITFSIRQTRVGKSLESIILNLTLPPLGALVLVPE